MRRAAAVLTALLAVSCSGVGANETGTNTTSTATGGPLPPITATEADARVVDFGRFDLPVQSPDGSQERVFRTYDAANPESRARGFMFVSEIPADVGMLFRFPSDSGGGFWMKDVNVPLSVAFADEQGTISDILDMQPCDAEPCKIYTPTNAYRYAFEVALGVFEQTGITTGWRLVVPDSLDPAQ